jgi:hypothetical protein
MIRRTMKVNLTTNRTIILPCKQNLPIYKVNTRQSELRKSDPELYVLKLNS